jgi:hypothetical protein
MKKIYQQKTNWVGIAIFGVGVYLLLTNKTDAGVAMVTLASGLFAYPEGKTNESN